MAAGTVKMIRDDDDHYIPLECCSMTNPVTSRGVSQIDDIDLPCGEGCERDCNDCIIQKVMDEYARITQQVVWIPCSEQLPEESGFYMVTKKINETGQCFVGKSRFDIQKGWNDPLNFVEITAWQPLPEGYNGQTGILEADMKEKINGICETIIRFIIDYYRENLFYPNYDEISRGVSRTKSTIHTHMERLEMEGVIIRKADSSPQYRLINMGFIMEHNSVEPGREYGKWIPAGNGQLNFISKEHQSETDR